MRQPRSLAARGLCKLTSLSQRIVLRGSGSSRTTYAAGTRLEPRMWAGSGGSSARVPSFWSIPNAAPDAR
jgi:hypothetical protein